MDFKFSLISNSEGGKKRYLIFFDYENCHPTGPPMHSAWLRAIFEPSDGSSSKKEAVIFCLRAHHCWLSFERSSQPKSYFINAPSMQPRHSTLKLHASFASAFGLERVVSFRHSSVTALFDAFLSV